MDDHFTSPLLLYSCVTLLSILFFLFLKGKKKFLKLPPSPLGWPVFGHMFSLGPLPHATMAKLKDKYGPVIWLKIGSVNSMVILSANAAADLFKNHDLSFNDRLIVETLTSHDYHKGSMAFSPYGPFWRMLRRLFNSGINTKILDDTLQVRRKCIDDMLSWIGKEAENAVIEKKGVKIIEYILVANANVIGNNLFSTDVMVPNSKTGSEFFEAVLGFFQWVGEPNISDLFSWLKPFDLQGLKKKMDRDMKKSMEIISGIVKERLQEKPKEGESQTKDMLDILLDFEGDGLEKLSEHTIVVFLLEVMMGGIVTTAHTTEWALAELLKNPEKLRDAKKEILKIVGKNRRLEESDIQKLPFLQAVIKETLRLHPVGPFILRKASKDTIFLGYDIPKGTHVMVNVWAIGTDPQLWSDPLSFKPERFLDSNIDFKGQFFEFIPFGAGRRICPGLPLALRVLPLMLGSLIHEFDWELEDSSSLDMSEKMGIVVHMLKPLRAIPRKSGC